MFVVPFTSCAFQGAGGPLRTITSWSYADYFGAWRNQLKTVCYGLCSVVGRRWAMRTAVVIASLGLKMTCPKNMSNRLWAACKFAGAAFNARLVLAMVG